VKQGKYETLEHGTFARDAAGKPVPAPEKPTSKIWITIAIPTAPMPPAGYPAVIIQHGLSGSRSFLLTLANTFANRGWIAVAIDSVTFGARANDPKFLVDTTSDYAGGPGVTYTGPDGISDAVGDETRKERAGSFDLFGGLKNLGALRDQFRQAEIDTTQVVKLLRANPDLSPLKTTGPDPKVDPDRIGYIGDSLGAIQGTVAASTEPHVKAWVMNVPGGGLVSEMAAHGPTINAQLALAASLNFGFTSAQYTEGHPMVPIAQTIAEGGDPIAYARHLVTSPLPLAGAPTKPRNYLQYQVIYDELVANEANESLARAGGWLLGTPNVGTNSGRTQVAASAPPFRGGGIVLDTVDPDATGFHDTPVAGVTAVLLQVSPGQHGQDLVRSRSARAYGVPYNAKNGGIVVDRLASTFPVPCPYRDLQAAATRFFQDAFDGKVPVVSGVPAPVRDVDGDGAPDESDPAPADPASK